MHRKQAARATSDHAPTEMRSPGGVRGRMWAGGDPSVVATPLSCIDSDSTVIPTVAADMDDAGDPAQRLRPAGAGGALVALASLALLVWLPEMSISTSISGQSAERESTGYYRADSRTQAGPAFSVAIAVDFSAVLGQVADMGERAAREWKGWGLGFGGEDRAAQPAGGPVRDVRALDPVSAPDATPGDGAMDAGVKDVSDTMNPRQLHQGNWRP